MKNKTKILYVIAPIFLASTLVGCGGKGGGETGNQTFTVKFDCSEIEQKIPNQKIKKNSIVIKPAITPTTGREDRVFSDYTVNGKHYNFNTPVTSDFTIKCSTEVAKFKVTLDPNAETKEGTRQITVKYGDKISKTELDAHTSKKDNMNFYSWLDEKGNWFDNSTEIKRNTTLTPGFVSNWIDISLVDSTNNTLNLDLDTNKDTKVEFKAKIGGVDVTVDSWHADVSSTDVIDVKESTNGCLVNINKDYDGDGRMVTLVAETIYNNEHYLGTIELGIGSYNKLDHILMGDGRVCAKGEEIAGDIVIPVKYFDYNSKKQWVDLESVEQNGFSNNQNIESVTFSDSIKTLNGYAFKGCTKLNKVELNASLNKIGQEAFYGCQALTSIKIPYSTNTIEPFAFVNTGLETVEFVNTDSWLYDSNIVVAKKLLDDPELVTACLTDLYCDKTLTRNSAAIPALNHNYIVLEKNDSYVSSANLYSNQDVTYESSDTNIATVDDDGYVETKNVSDNPVIITAKNPDSSLTNTCQIKVEGTTKLKLMGIEKQGDGGIGVDSNYKDIAYVSLPESINGTKITGIGLEGFRDTKNLKALYMPNYIERIGQNAFDGSGIESCIFSLSSNCTRIDEFAFANSHLSYINFPESINSIDPNAFFQCSNLTSVILPSQLQCVEAMTFYECSGLNTLVLPKTLNEIKTQAFYGCSQLKRIVFKGYTSEYKKIERLNENWHEGVPATTVQCIDGEVGIDDK